MNYRKMALTGHTSGIGKEIHDGLQIPVRGFSRTNGYDIDRAEDHHRLIGEVGDCDVFINNAKGNGLSQVHLLMDLFEVWKDQPKLIINIGSRAGTACEYRHEPSLYSIEKSALHSAVRQLQNSPRRCRMTNLAFGMIDTPANKNNKEKARQLPITISRQAVEYILAIDAEIAWLEIWPDTF